MSREQRFRALPSAVRRLAATGTALLTESFANASTAANAWATIGSACLTAGTSATPATSIPACAAAAPIDAAGSGVLRLNPATATYVATGAIANGSLPTANGLQFTFTDYSYGGAADGIAFFLADASLARPAALGGYGGSLGYAFGNGSPSGMAGAYVGIGLDQYGGFSSAQEGRTGGPGSVPETIAVRGSASTNWAYLGGATDASGVASSLAKPLDSQSATARPAAAPTIQVQLTAAGALSVAIDYHDGSGFNTYYAQTIVGVNGEPAVPANVYFGFTGATGGLAATHEIGGLSVSALSQTPVVPPASGFTPKAVTNLAAWYDASLAANFNATNGSIAGWNDSSGTTNTLGQSTASAQPTFTAAGINGLGSAVFGGKQYLVGANAAFSTNLYNESTVFMVTNQTGTADSAVAFSGVAGGDPRWSLRLLEQGASHFDFNNKEAGRLSATDKAPNAALWTAAGSISKKTQFLRKNGTLLASDTSGGATVTGNAPFEVGGMGIGSALTLPFVGQIGEIVTYNRLLTAAESASVEGYLACKWGLQNRLPANHPYRNACPQGGISVSTPLRPSPANALVDPQQLRSANGSLTFNVTAQADANGNPHFAYNGSTTPPTLRLVPGDTLFVNLTNNLPAPPAGQTMQHDAVNLHYHGLHVSPNAPGDDSIDMLAQPGQTLNYQIKIPANHPTGLYWYHTHSHGEAERDTLSGMSGALVIDGIAAYAPQIASMQERIIIARDAVLPGGVLPAIDRGQAAAMKFAMEKGVSVHGMTMPGVATDGRNRGELRGSTNAATRNPFVAINPNYKKFVRAAVATDSHCTTAEAAAHALTINGQTRPSIGIRPGEQQFWRMVNAGSDTYLDVAVDNTALSILAIDGVPIGNGTGTPTSMSVSHYVLPPASRVEFVVTGPPAGSATSYLRTNCFDAGGSGIAMPAQTLASIDPTTSLTDFVAHRPSGMPTAMAGMKGMAASENPAARISATAIAPHFRSAAALKSLAVAQTRTVVYDDQNHINGQAYDPAAAPMFYAQSGTTEEWTVVNNSSQVHTFHIHQIHFLVEAINGVTQSQEFVQDNVNVPAATASGPGSVKVLLDFTDPLDVGTFLFHCHILSHEDAGMMAKIRIGTAPPLALGSQTVTFASATAAAQTVSVTGGTAPYGVSGCSGVANASVTGTTVSLSPAGAGSCILTISDSSSPSISGTLSITVNGNAAVVTLNPTSLSFTSATAAAMTAAIAGGTAPYTVAGCANVATGSASGTTVSVSPLAAGTCTLTVSDAAKNTAALSVTVNATTGASSLDMPTFHGNAMRTGWYANETTLTTSNVASSGFHNVATLTAPSGMPAFGKVYAQPLYVTNELTADGTRHNLVIVSTSTDQVYAFDETTRKVVWHRDFTNPAAGVTQQSWTDTNCSDVNPNIGIQGTPVVDRTADKMFLVVHTDENGTAAMRLHAISLSNGNDSQAAVPVAATSALATGGVVNIDPRYNFDRSALLEANGNIYVGLSSHCDGNASITHGWIVSYNASTLQQTGSSVDLTNANPGNSYFLGAIWMGGFGPAADAQGNVYFATGNGPQDFKNDFAMSVLKLPGTLNLSGSSYFSPISSVSDSSGDEDLGSGGVMLLPDQPGAVPHMLLQGGKCGQGGCLKYLLNRDALGGQQANNAGALWSANVGGGIWGGPAYFQGPGNAQYVVYGTGSPLSTFALGTAPAGLTVQSSANVGCLECRDSGSQPVVSSNGTTAGTAIVWALKTPGNGGGTISLYAFDALNMSHTLYTAAAGTWTQAAGTSWIGGAMVSPLVAGGHVYVPTDGSVSVFGLQ